MKISSYFLSFFIVFFLYACKHSYYDIEKRELNSGVRNDSIFFDLHFGMTSKEFYPDGIDLATFIDENRKWLDVRTRKLLPSSLEFLELTPPPI